MLNSCLQRINCLSTPIGSQSSGEFDISGRWIPMPLSRINPKILRSVQMGNMQANALVISVMCLSITRENGGICRRSVPGGWSGVFADCFPGISLWCTVGPFLVAAPKGNSECYWKTQDFKLSISLLMACLLPKLLTAKPRLCPRHKCNQERQRVERGLPSPVPLPAHSMQAGRAMARHLSAFRFNTLSNIRL